MHTTRLVGAAMGAALLVLALGSPAWATTPVAQVPPAPDSVPKCVGELCGGPSHRRRLAEFRQTAGSQKALRKVTNTRWNRVQRRR